MDKLLTRAARTIKRRALIRVISVARKNEGGKRLLCGLFVESGDHATIYASMTLFPSLQFVFRCCRKCYSVFSLGNEVSALCYQFLVNFIYCRSPL